MWTKNISEKDWGRTLRARIHLRRTLGREPTRAEVDSADGLFKHVTREQVNDALGAGHEVHTVLASSRLDAKLTFCPW